MIRKAQASLKLIEFSVYARHQDDATPKRFMAVKRDAHERSNSTNARIFDEKRSLVECMLHR